MRMHPYRDAFFISRLRLNATAQRGKETQKCISDFNVGLAKLIVISGFAVKQLKNQSTN